MSAPAMSYDEIVRAAKALGVPDHVAERAAADYLAAQVAQDAAKPSILSVIDRASDQAVKEIAAHAGDKPFVGEAKWESRTLVHVGADQFARCPATIERRMDTLIASFEMPPRTKKNHGRFFGLAQSGAYVRYRDAIVAAVKQAKQELGLPLPDQPYNLAAVFYVDHYGKSADLFGLLQGIADVLENAGIVRDDWHFRTADGSRIVEGDETPRVEITITPIEV